MASLNLNEQLFIRMLARELGVSEAEIETAVSEAMLRAGCTEAIFTKPRLFSGGLCLELKGNDYRDAHEIPYPEWRSDFDGAKARLGRG